MTREVEMDSQRLVLVDGHVHFHREFEVGDFVESALSNLARTAGYEERATAACFVLAVVDSTEDDGFSRICEGLERATGRGPTEDGMWMRRETDEQTSECFARDEISVIIIRGRQLRTAENLEVLAIGTDSVLEDGLPINQTILSVADTGAVSVIPWGFGKWTGQRGHVLRELFETIDPASLYLGDNANRPRLGRRPEALSRAEAMGFRVLPGSDPLPFASECRSVGRAGFTLTGKLDVRCPARDLTRRLADTTTSISPFIDLESSFRFVRNQLRMQFKKHRL